MKINNSEDLKEVLMQCGASEVEIKYLGYPEAIRKAVVYLWLYQVPENEATAALREELLSLTQEGILTYGKLEPSSYLSNKKEEK